jgi:hypothetical protein
MLAGDHDVHVVPAAQAVVHYRQQTVGIRRQIHTDHLGLLIDYVIDESWILMRKAVVILPPDVRRQQVIQRGQRSTPRQMRRDLEPLGVLVEHRVDNMDESLIAIE